MNKTKARAVIKNLKAQGKQIHEEMVHTRAENSSSYASLQKWVVEFKRSRDCTEDDTRSGRRKHQPLMSNLMPLAKLFWMVNILLSIRELNPKCQFWFGLYCFKRDLGAEQAVCKMGSK